MNALRNRRSVFGWYHGISWPYKLLLASTVALATGYAAQLRIPLYWTPVPITMQTCVVLFSGIFLGCRWGALSQILYVSLGVFGVPFFSGMQGGLGVILGPRGGYLLGFILTSLLVGYFVERYQKFTNFFPLLFLLIGVSIICIYGLGCLQLGVWLWFVKGSSTSLLNILRMGCFPFVLGDFIKVFLVACVSSTFSPKTFLCKRIT